jgi:fructose-1,6-bisphosphatase I
MASNGVPVQNEKVNTDIVTLTRFLTEEQAKHKEATGDFTYDPGAFPDALKRSLT